MAKKKITKKPSKKGLKQKQKQSQSVVVNINTTKPRARKSPSQPVYRTQPQYITMHSEPSPPIIYNAPAVNLPAFEPVRTPVSTPVSTPVKNMNEIGIQSAFPETVFIKVKRPSKIPLRTREGVINLADIYNTPDATNVQENPMHTPIARRTRAQHPLTPEEIESRRLLRNKMAREKRLIKKDLGG